MREKEVGLLGKRALVASKLIVLVQLAQSRLALQENFGDVCFSIDLSRRDHFRPRVLSTDLEIALFIIVLCSSLSFGIRGGRVNGKVCEFEVSFENTHLPQ